MAQITNIEREITDIFTARQERKDAPGGTFVSFMAGFEALADGVMMQLDFVAAILYLERTHPNLVHDFYHAWMESRGEARVLQVTTEADFIALQVAGDDDIPARDELPGILEGMNDYLKPDHQVKAFIGDRETMQRLAQLADSLDDPTVTAACCCGCGIVISLAEARARGVGGAITWAAMYELQETGVFPPRSQTSQASTSLRPSTSRSSISGGIRWQTSR